MSKNLDIKIRETKDLQCDDLLWSSSSRHRSSSLIKIVGISSDVTWCGGKLGAPAPPGQLLTETLVMNRKVTVLRVAVVVAGFTLLGFIVKERSQKLQKIPSPNADV